MACYFRCNTARLQGRRNEVYKYIVPYGRGADDVCNIVFAVRIVLCIVLRMLYGQGRSCRLFVEPRHGA